MSVKGDEVIAGESGNVFEIAVTSKRGMVTVRSLDETANATWYTRATCFNGNGSSAKAITILAYGESCTIVCKYLPSSYQPSKLV